MNKPEQDTVQMLQKLGTFEKYRCIYDDPPWSKNQPSLVRAPRLDPSHQPEECVPIIERISHPPYLELFARRRPTSACPEQWDVWGNEIASDLYIPGYPVPQYSAKAVLPEEAR